MKGQISIGGFYLSDLLCRVSRQSFHEILQAAHISRSKGKDIVFTVGVYHGQGKLVVSLFSLQGISGKIIQKIFRPSLIPLVVKARMIVFHTLGKLGPQPVLLGDKQRSGDIFLHDRIQMFQELQRREIFVGSVYIRSPLARFPAVIQVQHGVHIVEP